MLRKIVRWAALGAATVLFILALFVPAWIFNVKAGSREGDGKTYGLFNLADWKDTSFNTGLMTFVGVLAIIALVAAVATLVLYLLNDLKILKLGKFERICSIVLAVVSLLLLVFVIICAIANGNKETNLFITTVTASLIPTAMLWIASIGGLAASVAAFMFADKK